MPDIRVYRSLTEAAGEFGPSGVTIGNFDGVHRGHQELFRRLAGLSRALEVRPAVVTFDPHPTKVVAPDRTPRLLTSLEQRLVRMRECGIERALVIPFDREFSKLTPEEFVLQVLVSAADARLVLVGGNFRFGNKQAGDTKLLSDLGERFGFETKIVEAVRYRGSTVSSTGIRLLIERGDVGLAARSLGRPFGLEGVVIPGHGVGSRQTVPTLNLETSTEVLPAGGVYITRTQDTKDGRLWPSVTNIGYRPTFGGDDKLNIETFILEGFARPVPEQITVEFLRRIREERKFPDASALKAQILRDAARAQAFFRRAGRWIRAGAW